MEPNVAVVNQIDETVENSAEIIPIKPILSLGTVRIEIAPYGVMMIDNRSTFIRYPTPEMVEHGQILEYGLRRDNDRRARFFLKINDVWEGVRFSILDNE